MGKSLERRWVERAGADTLAFFGLKKHALYFTCFTLASILFGLYSFVGKEAMRAEFVAILFGLIPIFGLFVWNYCHAPKKIQQEAEDLIATQRNEIDALKIKPKLKIEYIEGDSKYQQWDPDAINPRWLLHRISVHNESQNIQIKKVRVELHDFQGAETWARGLPFGLHIKDRKKQPECFDPEMDLDADQIAFFDLVSLAKREMNEVCVLNPARSWSNYEYIPLSKNEYVLQIKIFAEGKKYCEKCYKLIKGNPNNNVYYRLIEAR